MRTEKTLRMNTNESNIFVNVLVIVANELA